MDPLFRLKRCLVGKHKVHLSLDLYSLLNGDAAPDKIEAVVGIAVHLVYFTRGSFSPMDEPAASVGTDVSIRIHVTDQYHPAAAERTVYAVTVRIFMKTFLYVMADLAFTCMMILIFFFVGVVF